ncbi:Major facilitator superfamily [Aphelenchoides avenae]|nr:Major facilitator superfamily [Aphelenchus avenae]
MAQTTFVIFYLMFAPLFGYLGDRFNRKWILIVGISIWMLAVLASSFCESFVPFLLMRGIVGIGEASYSTVAPTMISDLFTGATRSMILMAFYSAIPIGSGIGFIMGSEASNLFGSWHWGVRITVLFGIPCLLALVFILQEPARGQAERAILERTSYTEDLQYLFRIRTYWWVVIAFTCVCFATGAVSWWAPTLAQHAWGMLHGTTTVPDYEKATISTHFGLITCFGGLTGVFTGSLIAKWWRQGMYCFTANECADPWVCFAGAVITLPFFGAALTAMGRSMPLAWVFVFFCVTCMCLNMAITTDIIMSVTVPNRRATAIAILTLVAHLLGDASSPYAVGVVSDWFRGEDQSAVGLFMALRNALSLNFGMLFLSTVCFLFVVHYIGEDRQRNEQMMHDNYAQSLLRDPDSGDDHTDPQEENIFQRRQEEARPALEASP